MPREKLVLLPGMMCDERLFSAQRAALEDAYDIVTPRLAGSESVEGLAHSVLNQAGVGPLNVAGLSMGGIVAMAMLEAAPKSIGRLALLDTNHLADLPARQAIRDRQIADVRAGKLREVIIDEMKPNYLAAANRGRRDLLDLLVDMAMDLGPDVFISQSLALRNRPSFEATLRSFEGPALVLHGAEDQLCPPERHREIASLLRSPLLVEIPGAGHLPTLEKPEAVLASIKKWLAMPIGRQAQS